MTSTIDISFYPLRDDYPAAVLDFLKQLKTIPEIEMHTNGMSTVLIGDYQNVWQHLGRLMEMEMASMSSVFVMKVAPGRREFTDND